jgi:BirA family transcriptional regulator, biotin operon repressor / biotin---[acetyl-CoA-carboxylase] ligase
VADRQTEGRGRSGNKWESPKGGLWFSILLRPNVVSSKLPLLQFLIANSTRQALEDETGLPVKLKWPNDILLNGQKLGGILIESKTQGDAISFVVVGIGLNINVSQDKIPENAASLEAQTGIRYDENRILSAIIDRTKLRYKDLNRPRPTRILEEWWRNCVHRLTRVQVTIDGRTVEGVATAVGGDGSLLIRTDDDRFEKVTDGSLTLLND